MNARRVRKVLSLESNAVKHTYWFRDCSVLEMATTDNQYVLRNGNGNRALAAVYPGRRCMV
jgi:hypothetical protein